MSWGGPRGAAGGQLALRGFALRCSAAHFCVVRVEERDMYSICTLLHVRLRQLRVSARQNLLGTGVVIPHSVRSALRHAGK